MNPIQQEIDRLHGDLPKREALIVTHYDSEVVDEEEYCSGDYTGVSVWVDRKCVCVFGDHYHEKGADRAAAYALAIADMRWIDCWKYASTSKFQTTQVKLHALYDVLNAH